VTPFEFLGKFYGSWKLSPLCSLRWRFFEPSLPRLDTIQLYARHTDGRTDVSVIAKTGHLHCKLYWRPVKSVWPNWHSLTLEWRSTGDIAEMSPQMLPAIQHIAVYLFVYQQDSTSCVAKNLRQGCVRSFSPSPPFPSLPFPFPSSLPLPLLPLRSRPPYIQLVALGSAVSSPSGVWGGAPAEIDFGAF